MVKFGSEPWFEPERNRTECQIGVEVRPLDPDRTDGSVQGSAHLSFSENASEHGLNPNPSKVFGILFDMRMKPCSSIDSLKCTKIAAIVCCSCMACEIAWV
jgi:hypothetical protein